MQTKKIITRAYPFKDVETLLVAKILVRLFITQKAGLMRVRPGLADPYLAIFEQRIDDAIRDILGINPQSDLTQLTTTVNTQMNEALNKLGTFKVQVEFDYIEKPKRMKEILAALGFTPFYTQASRSKDQEMVIEMLNRFKGGMTAAMQTEMINNGVAADLIAEIIGLAVTMSNSNVSQEDMKGTKKTINAEGVEEINAIYHICIMLCKLAKKLPSLPASEKEKFSFKATVKRLNAPQPPPDEKPDDKNVA